MYSSALLTFDSLLVCFYPPVHGLIFREKSEFCFPSSFDVSPTLSLETPRFMKTRLIISLRARH